MQSVPITSCPGGSSIPNLLSEARDIGMGTQRFCARGGRKCPFLRKDVGSCQGGGQGKHMEIAFCKNKWACSPCTSQNLTRQYLWSTCRGYNLLGVPRAAPGPACAEVSDPTVCYGGGGPAGSPVLGCICPLLVQDQGHSCSDVLKSLGLKPVHLGGFLCSIWYGIITKC